MLASNDVSDHVTHSNSGLEFKSRVRVRLRVRIPCSSPEFDYKFEFEFESEFRVRGCHVITDIITSQHSSLLNEQLLLITKCDSSVYYKVRHRVRQAFLQSAASVITKCDKCYYKMRRYYKVWRYSRASECCTAEGIHSQITCNIPYMITRVSFHVPTFFLGSFNWPTISKFVRTHYFPTLFVCACFSRYRDPPVIQLTWADMSPF